MKIETTSTDYEPILEVLALEMAHDELMIFVKDDISPIGVVMQWNDGNDCYVLYRGSDVNGVEDTLWYIDEFVDGVEQWEFSDVCSAMAKMVSLRNA